MKARALAVVLLMGVGNVSAAQNGAAPAGARRTTTAPPASHRPSSRRPTEQPPVYEEAVVVSASKVEQQIVNAPATVTVITSDVIQSTPANNFAELLRAVPGMNLTQTSARDYNLNMRGRHLDACPPRSSPCSTAAASTSTSSASSPGTWCPPTRSS